MLIKTVFKAKMYIIFLNTVLVFQNISCSGILVGFNQHPLAPLVAQIKPVV